MITGKSGRILLLSVILSLATACSVAASETAADGGLAIKGFGTLGVARSDNDGAQFVRDLSQPDGLTSEWSGKIDSMIGLQADYRFSDDVQGGVQAVSRYRYDGSYTPDISWAFLRHDPSPALSLRIGRLGTEFYMLADSRLVGYANLTVRPPPDYFGPLVFSNIDGLDIGLTAQAGDGGLLRGKFFAGLSPEKTPFIDTIPWDLRGSLLVGGHLDYLIGPWQVRVGHAQVRFDNELPLNAMAGFDVIAMAPELSVVDTWSRFDSLGVVYDEGPLQLQLMLSRTEHETSAYEDTTAGYAIAAYRIGNLTPYLGYSRVKSTSVSIATPLTPPVAGLVADITSGTHSDQQTWFLGGRWDFRQDMALKAQLDLISGSPSSVFPFRADMPAWDGDMAVFSLALDFVF